MLDVPEIPYEVPEWYRDAKFGIFIHYGIYSVPAYGDEWYGHWMYIPNSVTYGNDDIFTHHKETYGGAEIKGYKDFIPEFLDGIREWSRNNGAEQWADLFEKAGAKYVVPVGIHHDAYALYPSEIQKTYNSAAGAGVDYIGALKQAVTARGMKFGISNHFAENDWFFDEVYGKGTDMVLPEFAELYGTGGDKTREHVEKWYAISTEIIRKYQPDLIYFDFDLENDAFNRYTDANRYRMLSEYYALAKTWDGCAGVVCNYKYGAFTEDMAVPDRERESLGTIHPAPWQTDTSVGAKSWGFITNETYRSGAEFITALIDIVSKNGNLLLNIGPKADGTIPAEAREILETIGAWLDVYGDAIYATRPWTVYGEGKTENSGDNYRYTGKDIRFTKSRDDRHLYISALGEPENQIISVETLQKRRWNAEEIERICLMNGNERVPLAWQQTDHALQIFLPDGINGACAVDVTFQDGGTIPQLLLSADEVIQLCGSTEYLLEFNRDTNILLVGISGGNAGVIQVFLNDQDEPLCKIEIAETTSDEMRILTQKIPITDGAHKVRFSVSEGITLHQFKFCRPIAADEQIEAESFDLQKGNVRAEPCAEGGENLGYVSEGDYVCYADVDFSAGKTELHIRLAGSGQQCNVRLDSPDGKVICRAGGTDTGGWQTYQTFDYGIPETKGVHNVFITYDSGWSDLNITWFRFL